MKSLTCLNCGRKQKMKRIVSIWLNLTVNSTGMGDHLATVYWCPLCGCVHRIEDLTQKDGTEKRKEKTFKPKYGLRSTGS